MRDPHREPMQDEFDGIDSVALIGVFAAGLTDSSPAFRRWRRQVDRLVRALERPALANLPGLAQIGALVAAASHVRRELTAAALARRRKVEGPGVASRALSNRSGQVHDSTVAFLCSRSEAVAP